MSIMQIQDKIQSIDKKAFKYGLKSGIPIGLGYFAVSFSLGVWVIKAGLNAFGGAIVSLFCNASAGEYAGFRIMAEDGGFLLMALMTVVADSRYLLMSSAMSQRVAPNLSMGHRMLMGLYVTDEIFAVSMQRPGDLNPWFTYGTAMVASPSWALGTAIGCIVGNILPQRVVSALSVALFGMFLAIIIPAAKKNKIIAGVIAACFALSSAAAYIPFVSGINESIRTVILTVVISAGAALLFPIKEEENTTCSSDKSDGSADGCGGNMQ